MGLVGSRRFFMVLAGSKRFFKGLQVDVQFMKIDMSMDLRQI